jgi:DNA-binding transcriptional ArsR family regulator
MEQIRINPGYLEQAANMLKAIAHPIRILIMDCLQDGKEHSVTEIHKKLEIEQSVTSHHLGILKDKGVLASRRIGKNTYYFLKHVNIRTLLDCINSCCRLNEG